MLCYICGEKNWLERKDLNPESTVGICKNCGNVAHLLADDQEAKIKDFYRYHYRGAPGVNNILTTTTKLNMIKLFLMDYLKDKKELKVADIGSATGYLLDFFRRNGHKVTGTELTPSFRRFSEHYYGIPLTEELTTKHRYDLITYYHTLEHLVNPYEKLKAHSELLAENGCIMVSVPEWFSTLENLAALGKFTIDNYFHKNHINCFSRISMHNLIKRCGLKIVKEDYITYGQTYLLERTSKKQEIVKEDYKKINEKIDLIKKTIGLFGKGKVKDAIDLYPDFPDAHLQLVFDSYRKDPERQKHCLDEVLKKFPNNKKLMLGYASWLYQNQEYEQALEEYKKIINISPKDDILIYMGYCAERLGQYPQAMQYFNSAINMNPQKWTECMSWICKCASSLKSWDERATEELKEQMFKKANPQIDLKEALV